MVQKPGHNWYKVPCDMVQNPGYHWNKVPCYMVFNPGYHWNKVPCYMVNKPEYHWNKVLCYMVHKPGHLVDTKQNKLLAKEVKDRKGIIKHKIRKLKSRELGNVQQILLRQLNLFEDLKRMRSNRIPQIILEWNAESNARNRKPIEQSIYRKNR